jgi:hypothetical protein
MQNLHKTWVTAIAVIIFCLYLYEGTSTKVMFAPMKQVENGLMAYI